jgi:hypothetical protein
MVWCGQELCHSGAKTAPYTVGWDIYRPLKTNAIFWRMSHLYGFNPCRAHHSESYVKPLKLFRYGISHSAFWLFLNRTPHCAKSANNCGTWRNGACNPRGTARPVPNNH